MKHRFYPTLAAAAGLTLVLSACGSGGTSSGASGGEPATDGTFRFACRPIRVLSTRSCRPPRRPPSCRVWRTTT